MISAVILTKNEEKNIKDCLQTLQWCDEIIVIDDNSTDKTVAIAKKFATKVLMHTLNNNFSSQRNFGLSKTGGEWVLFVDADERISEELAKKIKSKISDMNLTMQGYFIKRVDTMWGKRLKHGETGNMQLLRLAKKDAGKWKGNVHEQWHIKGPTGHITNPMYHYPHPTITEFLQEINYYSSLRSKELFEQKIHVSFFDIIVYPKTKFIRNYIIKKGFLDGTAGFVIAVCMSFHSFLVRGKLWQLWQKK